eukprot:m.397701 g.397701  ORF g.397701 m.397701 type:complete len:129 (-) comp20107_c2_seq11:80-466(-)
MVGMMIINHQGVRSDFGTHPWLGFKMMFVGFVLAVFPGMVPGAVWQLVYAFGTHQRWGTAATALAVASAVCTCNLLFGKFCDWVNACLFPDQEGYDANGFSHFHPEANSEYGSVESSQHTQHPGQSPC